MLLPDPIPKRNRIAAVAGASLCAVILVLELKNWLGSPKAKIATDFILLFLFILQALFPRRGIFMSVATMFASLVNVYYGGNLLGVIFYAFGLAVLLKEGFFRKGRRYKLPILFALFALSLVLQFHLGYRKVIVSLVNIAIAVTLIWGFLYIFRESFSEFFSLRPPLDLRIYGLTDRQIACVRGCKENRNIRAIAEAECVSPSVIKKECIAIYSILGVEDWHDLRRLLIDREIRV